MRGNSPVLLKEDFCRIHGKSGEQKPSLVATVEEKHPDPGTHRFREEDKGGT